MSAWTILALISLLCTLVTIVLVNDRFISVAKVVATFGLSGIVFLPEADTFMRGLSAGVLIAAVILDIAYTMTRHR